MTPIVFKHMIWILTFLLFWSHIAYRSISYILNTTRAFLILLGKVVNIDTKHYISLVSIHPLRLYFYLTHWCRVTHICVGKLTISGSDNGLSPGRRQAIVWTNAEILLIGPLGTNFGEIWIEIDVFSFKEMHLKMSPGKWLPFWLGLDVLSK